MDHSSGVKSSSKVTRTESSAIQKRAAELYAEVGVDGVMDQEKWIECVRQARQEIEGQDERE